MGEGRLTPLEGGAGEGDAEGEGEHPVGQVRALRRLLLGHGLDFQGGGEHLAVLLVEVADVGRGDGDGGFGAEEELEQELVAGRLVIEGLGEPLLEALAAGGGDGVLPATGFGGGRGGLDEAFGGEALEGGIDLAVALAPEVADAGFDGFSDVVAGEVGFDSEEAEDDVVGAGVVHIANRYI